MIDYYNSTHKRGAVKNAPTNKPKKKTPKNDYTEGTENAFKLLLIFVGLLMLISSPVLGENWVEIGDARPSKNTTKEADFGPYMRELQRRIKNNWAPPRRSQNKRVVVLLKIAKDGRLLSCSIFKSSGLLNVDNAALNAVKFAAPFGPLPAEYNPPSIDIQFTFDYGFYGFQSINTR